MNMEPLVASEQAARGGEKGIVKMGERVAKARPHTLVEEDLVGVREAVKELDYKVEALDTKIDTVEMALTTKIDTAVVTVNTKIDTVETALTTKIDNAVVTLTTKIDNAVVTLNTKIDTKIDTAVAVLNIQLGELGKGMGEMKLWVKWGVGVVGGLVGAMVAIMGFK